MKLYGYWRSSSAYRVRIALNLKGISYSAVATNLRRGAHRTLEYAERNPQGLVPLLEDGELRLAQSLAILEYLDETWPEPRLLPAEPAARAEVRSLALLMSCEIQPLNNRRVLSYLERRLALETPDLHSWYRYWVAEGFAAVEAQLKRSAGRFCFGDGLTLADLCLVPQVYDARRYKCDLKPFPLIRRIEETCLALPAFDAARPENQPDAA